MKARILASRTMSIHRKCLTTDKPYLKSDNVFRFKVPEDKVKWDVKFDDYRPVEYTDPSTEGKPWADGPINKNMKFNDIDGDIDRRSKMGVYKFDDDDRPLNPVGRTGLRGRGILGKWGPNHAGDPIVSRFKDGKLQFIGIKRGDTGEWALPGGMVDPGETATSTAKREFTEEALDNVEDKNLDDLFNSGKVLYEGYVDDHRNTDNSWMETTVINFHDDKDVLSKAKVKAGSDAAHVEFVTVESGIELYASHNDFVKMFAKLHGVEI
ncbi:unnamed protein product [Bursaphelenchus okinawaensis]|uniref:Nudix hydrolase domain-containing protein n=1 Tax=Bursaphelenchus okinawaensis TaxID=465554 RepID=A0A811K998_9BILA|nr:unnamed protein product [Bursaphelenchus okinawaensis]CAG9094993.1 unnamed protein product [Bursaphelenchus okinawaensis]